MSNSPQTVYFIPITHHDLGYTHTIDDLLAAYCSYYDDVLDFCDKTVDYPEEAKYRYTVEAFWSLDHYLTHTSNKNRQRMYHYIREGRIELPALYANIIDEICSEEQLARVMYPSFALAKELGVTIQTASLTDMPGLSNGTIKALCAAGVKNLFAGFPQYFRWGDAQGVVPPMQHAYWNEDTVPWGHPAAFHWQAPDGGKILTWFQDGYGWFGDEHAALQPYETYEDIEARLPGFLQAIKERGCPYHVMRYIDHGSDNERPSMGICNIVKRWNEEHSDIRLVVGTTAMFFDELRLDTEAITLPTVMGTLPQTDYTTLSLTEAGTTTLNARSKRRALAAESVLAMCGGGETALCDSVFRAATLFDEHCFGMSMPFGYNHEYNRLLKTGYAYDAARRADLMWQHATGKLSRSIDHYSIATFRPGYGIATLLSDGPLFGEESTIGELIGSHGERLQVQRDEVNHPLLGIEGVENALAMLLPGHKLYQYTIPVPSEGLSLTSYTYAARQAPTCEHEDGILENDYYHIKFDAATGRIYSILDKQTGRELCDGDAFGQVITRDIRDNSCHPMRYRGCVRRLQGSVADNLVITADTYAVPSVVMELTLYHTAKRIDLSYRLTWDRTPQREVYIELPFSGDAPHFTYRSNGSLIRAFDDIISGGNTNQCAVDEYCTVSDSNHAIVLACEQTSLVSFGGAHPTAVSHAHHLIHPKGYTDPFVKKEDIHCAHLYIMTSYNNCRTNFSVTQSGDAIYRFSLTSGQSDVINAECFAGSCVCPPRLMPGVCTPAGLSVTPESVIPVCYKLAEDGNGYVLRLRETSGEHITAAVRIDGMTVTQAYGCTLTEDTQEPISLQEITLKPYETRTLRFIPKSNA